MDQSYITHQRRPALIPAGVELSPEDEQAVRLRTGYVNPSSKHDAVFFNVNPFAPVNDRSSAPSPQANPAGKRKASALDEEGPAHELEGSSSRGASSDMEKTSKSAPLCLIPLVAHEHWLSQYAEGQDQCFDLI